MLNDVAMLLFIYLCFMSDALSLRIFISRITLRHAGAILR